MSLTKETYQKAIQNEILSRNLYLFLARTTKNETIKEKFESLSKFEKVHEEKLTKIFKDNFKNEKLVVNRTKLPDIVVEKDSFQNIKDVLNFAIQQEKIMHDKYINMAKQTDDEELKEILEGLAAEEIDHKEVLSDEIVALQGDYIWFDPSELNGMMEDL